MSGDIASLTKEYNKQVHLGHTARANEIQLELNRLKNAANKLDCSTCPHKKDVENQVSLAGEFKKVMNRCSMYDQEIRLNHEMWYRFFQNGILYHEAAVLNCQFHIDAKPLAPVKIQASVRMKPQKFEDYPVLVTFIEHFEKLDLKIFTTLRSVSFNKNCQDYPNFPKGAIGRYIVEKKVMPELVKCLDWIDNKIGEFSLDVLQADIAPHKCPDHAAIIEFLNQIARSNVQHPYGNNSINTVKRLFFFEKVGVAA